MRIDEVEHLDVARRGDGIRVVEEEKTERAPTALVRSDGALACDLLELGHALALLVDAALQLGDAGVELPGLVERIEVRVGDLVDLRLGLGDGLVRLGDRISLLRERRHCGSSEEDSQQRAEIHENGTAPVMHVQPLLPAARPAPLHPEQDAPERLKRYRMDPLTSRTRRAEIPVTAVG